MPYGAHGIRNGFANKCQATFDVSDCFVNAMKHIQTDW